ncbi:MAG: mechanosensitive ion channel [Nannocystaceae bacterium]
MPQMFAVCVVVVLGLLTGVVPVPPVVAAPAAAEATPAGGDAADEVALPGRYELVPRAADLEGDAADVQAQITRMASDGEILETLKAARTRRTAIRDQLAGLQHETYPRLDRIAQVREQAHLQRSEVEREDERLRTRLKALDELRAAWIERREFWTKWRASLIRETDPTAAGSQEFRKALATIGKVIDQSSGVYSTLLGHQRALATVRRDLLSLEIHAEDQIREGNRRRWTRDAPVLLSPAFFERLGAVSGAEIQEGIAGTPGIDPAFLERVRWVILTHVALIVGLALFLLRIRRHLGVGRGDAGQSMSGLLVGPKRTAIFVGTATVSFLYQPMPGLWEAGILAILAAAGASLAPVLLPRGERGLAYLLAGIYPPLFVLGVAAFPAPLFRLLLALLCLVGAPLLIRAARRQPAQTRRSRAFRLFLYLGAAELGIALVTQFAGFERFSRWLVESLVATAFIIYVVVFLLELANGVTTALSRVQARADATFLERAGARLSSQMRWIFRGMMVIGAVLYAGSIWGFFDSATEIWARLAAIEIRGGELRVRLGSLVGAGLTIYLGFVVSWALRTLLDIHVFERRRVEAGVRASIAAILHYSLIVLGVFTGLGVLGVSLESFALIFGALGVGIGFGLQNIVNNFVSGLILLFERPVRVGDTVVIAGEWGVIRKIGLRSTVVLSYDNSELIVPNSDLVSEKVTNWTLSDKSARVIVPVGVAYGSDVPLVLKILEGVGRGHPRALSAPPAMVLFMGFGDSSLDFELRLWIADADLRLIVRSELLAAIDAAFAENDIEIPFPQRDLHVRSIDEGAAALLGTRRG